MTIHYYWSSCKQTKLEGCTSKQDSKLLSFIYCPSPKAHNQPTNQPTCFDLAVTTAVNASVVKLRSGVGIALR